MRRVLVVLLSTLLAAACSSAAATDPIPDPTPDPTPGSVPAPDGPGIARAIEIARQATSGRATFTMAVEADDGSGGAGTAIQTTSAFDDATARRSITLAIPDPSGLREFMWTVVDGRQLYVRNGLWDNGSTWITRTISEEAEPALAELAGPEFAVGVIEPASVLLEAEALRPDGSEALDGDRVDRFLTSVSMGDVVELMDAMGDTEKAMGMSLHDLVRDLDVVDDRVPVIVWLWPDGSLRGYELSYAKVDRSRGSLAVQISLDLYDYGEQITIEVPDPAEVEGEAP